MSALAIFVMAFREGFAIFATVCNKTIYYQTLSNLPLKKGYPDYDSMVNAKLNGNRWHYGAVNVDSIWTHGQFGNRLSYLYPRLILLRRRVHVVSRMMLFLYSFLMEFAIFLHPLIG